jgi:hypothetical protein
MLFAQGFQLSKNSSSSPRPSTFFFPFYDHHYLSQNWNFDIDSIKIFISMVVDKGKE